MKYSKKPILKLPQYLWEFFQIKTQLQLSKDLSFYMFSSFLVFEILNFENDFRTVELQY